MVLRSTEKQLSQYCPPSLQHSEIDPSMRVACTISTVPEDHSHTTIGLIANATCETHLHSIMVT